MASSYRHPYIAREGWGVLFVLLASAGVFGWVVGLVEALPLLLLTALVAFYCRDPIRQIPSRPLGVVSPVDGVVRSLGEGRDPYLERENSRRLRLRQGILGVHSLRSPIEGKVMERWSWRRRGGGRVETVAYWIRTDEDDDVVWTLSLVSHKLLRMELQPGERIGQGQRCGFALFPAFSTLYLPKTSRLMVRPGQRVRAGEAVLAEFVHRRLDVETTLEGRHAVS